MHTRIHFMSSALAMIVDPTVVPGPAAGVIRRFRTD